MDYEAAHTVLYMQKVNTVHNGVHRRNDRNTPFIVLSVCTQVSLVTTTNEHRTRAHWRREGGLRAKEGCTGGVCENTNVTIKPHRSHTSYHLPFPGTQCTHLVPVLWVHLQYLYQVACYLTVAFLGCPVKHGVGIFSLLMDSYPKHRGQVFDDLQLPTYCGFVHGIEAILHSKDHTDGRTQ